MLKKLLVIAVLLGVAIGLLLLTARGQRFTCESAVLLPMSQESVWQALAVVENWPLWWPGVKQARLAPASAGAGGQLLLSLTGMPDGDPATLLIWQPSEILRFQRRGVLMSRTETEFALQPAANGVMVRFSLEVRGPQALLARWLRQEDFSLYTEAVTLSLQRYLERPPAVVQEGEAFAR